MKHTYTHFRGYLRKNAHDIAFGLVAGLFVGVVAVSHSTHNQAHFFQRTYSQPKVAVSSSSQRRLIIQRTNMVMGITDDVGHAAAGDEPTVATSSETSSVSGIVEVSEPESSSSQSTNAQRVTTPSSAAAEPPSADALRTMHPVSRVPNWGAMRTPAEWDRTFSQMTSQDFVPVPSYTLSSLTIPLSTLVKPLNATNIKLITAKLYYSTRYMGQYDLDATEHSGSHDGVDLKLARGTPVGAIGNGEVYDVRTDDVLGKHVLIEHRTASGERFLSIYGHLESVSVSKGQDVEPGQAVGTVGMTGNTSGPHLHLAVHEKKGDSPWQAYDASESINPMHFIAKYRGGE